MSRIVFIIVLLLVCIPMTHQEAPPAKNPIQQMNDSHQLIHEILEIIKEKERLRKEKKRPNKERIVCGNTCEA